MPATLPISAEMAAMLARAEAILEHGVDNAGVPLTALLRAIAVDNIRWLGNAPFDQSRADGHRQAGVAQTKGLGLEAAGVFEAYAVGSRVRVTSRSIARYRLACALMSHPAGAPPTKIRLPSQRYQPRRGAPLTENERAGLAEGNRQRAEQARKREARKAARV